MDEVKKCRKCSKMLNIKHFNPDRLGKFGVASTCKLCIEEKKAEKLKNYVPKIYKAPNKISKRKQARIKRTGGELKMFKEIAIERNIDGYVYCEKCNKSISLDILNHWNFDHKIPKSKGEEYRNDKLNIDILCIACHFKKTNGQELKVEYNN